MYILAHRTYFNSSYYLGGLLKYYSSILHFVSMSKTEQSSFLKAKNETNKTSKEDLIEALKKVEESNNKIRDSFKYDRESMSFRAGR